MKYFHDAEAEKDGEQVSDLKPTSTQQNIGMVNDEPISKINVIAPLEGSEAEMQDNLEELCKEN